MMPRAGGAYNALGAAYGRLSAFMFGFVPYRRADFFLEGEIVPFDPGPQYRDCLDDIAHARSICEALGKDYIVVDLTEPQIGFPAVQVVIPGYSDVVTDTVQQVLGRAPVSFDRFARDHRAAWE